MVYGSGSARKFVPSDLPNLAAWFAFTRGITSVAGLVSQWSDQSGNGRHLKQATATNQPALQSDGSILFDGVDNFLKCDPFTLNQPETVYIVFKAIVWTQTVRYFDGNASGSGILSPDSATPDMRIFAGSSAANNTNLAINAYGAVACVFNGASSVLQVNNTAPATGDVGVGNMGGFTVGANGANANFANIQVKEVVLYSAAHDANQRQTVINYLASVGQVSI